MKPAIASLSLLAVLAIWTLNALAQSTSAVTPVGVPRLVNFSGTAADTSGKVLSGTVGVTFAIYKEQEGGAPLWMETQNVAADRSGSYTAQLGVSKPDGLPLDLFTSGEARWLGVRVNGGEEQSRVLLLSVPYALKAADAQTLGGLPPSAFVLAAPAAGAGTTPAVETSPAVPAGAVPPAASSAVTTTGGTINAIPLWTTATNVQTSLLSQTGTTAVNVGGKLNLPATATATATKGANSQAESLAASAYNSSTKKTTAQTFQWQAEPASNNTANASGTLNLLFGAGAAAPAETGLKINNKGAIAFAPTQTFPASVGTVQSVSLTAPQEFVVSGSPVTGSGTINLNWNTPPTPADTPTALVKRDSNGGFSAGGIIANGQASTSINAITGTIAGGQVLSNGPNGVFGATNNATGHGVFGSNPSGAGLAGLGLDGLRAIGGNYGVYGLSEGNSTASDGVHGETYSSSAAGVAGYNNAASGIGVYGSAPTYGVYGTAANTGVYGLGNSYGVTGTSTSGSGSGVGAFNSTTGDALFASNQSGGLAGYFLGDVTVNGNLSKGGGSFQIDHPTDPANKFLFHSFVESPDMMNIYNGNITTDANGDAIVTMPDWFEALNRDFRYQLTVIGQFAQAIVASKMEGNHFAIKTDKPNVEVSWQVTGIRHDAWADAHRIPVEQPKPENQRGFYLHPELFGAPADKSIGLLRHPEAARLKDHPSRDSKGSPLAAPTQK
jgi:hypothetical protein